MTHIVIARGMLAILCGMQGAGTLAIDLNRTHATNPIWPKHARFHLVWQAMSYAVLSLLEIALILAPCPFQGQRFYLAATLAFIPMLSFLAAFVWRKRYDGALSDPNGIPPVKVVVFSSELHFDLSLLAEMLALSMLVGIVALFKY